MEKAITYRRQTDVFSPERIQTIRYRHISLVRYCRSILSAKSLFSSQMDLGDFYQICLHSRLPPCLRLSVRRISHFRSRCKVNSGIGWKCRVKPPVSAFRVLLCNVLFPFHSWRSDGRSCP